MRLLVAQGDRTLSLNFNPQAAKSLHHNIVQYLHVSYVAPKTLFVYFISHYAGEVLIIEDNNNLKNYTNTK